MPSFNNTVRDLASGGMSESLISPLMFLAFIATLRLELRVILKEVRPISAGLFIVSTPSISTVKNREGSFAVKVMGSLGLRPSAVKTVPKGTHHLKEIAKST